MADTSVQLEIDPFFISYKSETLPLLPTGEPEVLHDIPDYLVFGLLGCIQTLLMGEIYSFKFIDGPHALILIPWGGETTLIFQTNYINHFKNEHSITVPTSELISAILRVARKMLDDVDRDFIFNDIRERLILFYERSINLVYMFGYHYPE